MTPTAHFLRKRMNVVTLQDTFYMSDCGRIYIVKEENWQTAG
jgi:hypothetical protein